MSSLMFYCLKVLISAIYERWVTDPQTDQRTDKASYRDAWTHLKSPVHHIAISHYAQNLTLALSYSILLRSTTHITSH